MLKAVIFDLDDTLANSHEVIVPAMEKIFERYLSHFPGKSAQEMVNLERETNHEHFTQRKVPTPTALTLVWISLFEKLGLKPDLKAIVKMRREAWEEVYKTNNLLPGAEDLIDWIKEKQLKIGVLTNGPFIEQAEKLISLGIDNKIDYLVGTDLTMADKPDPKAFQYLLEKLKVTAQEAIMVGDYVRFDIVGARSVGMRSVLLRHDFRPHTLEEEKLADFVADNLFEVKKYLNSQI